MLRALSSSSTSRSIARSRGDERIVSEAGTNDSDSRNAPDSVRVTSPSFMETVSSSASPEKSSRKFFRANGISPSLSSAVSSATRTISVSYRVGGPPPAPSRRTFVPSRTTGNAR